jgi:hypothetical protein
MSFKFHLAADNFLSSSDTELACCRYVSAGTRGHETTAVSKIQPSGDKEDHELQASAVHSFWQTIRNKVLTKILQYLSWSFMITTTTTTTKTRTSLSFCWQPDLSENCTVEFMLLLLLLVSSYAACKTFTRWYHERFLIYQFLRSWYRIIWDEDLNWKKLVVQFFVPVN